MSTVQEKYEGIIYIETRDIDHDNERRKSNKIQECNTNVDHKIKSGQWISILLVNKQEKSSLVKMFLEAPQDRIMRDLTG